MIESTFAKAHRTASSLAFDGQARELGKSHGGITSKIHLLCNNESKPIDFIITGGQVHDIKIAPKLVSRNKMRYLDNQAWMDHITSGDYQRYYEDMYSNR